MPPPDEVAIEGATGLLYFVRRYAAKLLYEIEFHTAEDPTSMRPRYVELLADALKISPSPTDYLADMDGGFYVTEYLGSWAVEAQLRDYLRHKFGNDWFAGREAGGLLRELWSLGQRYNADELLEDVTGARLQMVSVADRIREVLPSNGSRQAPPSGLARGGLRRPCIGAYSVSMTRKRIVIVGAAGRDFHNFNLVHRGREDVEVVAFTATQIPNIEGRVYPAELAGELYPAGIPIVAEDELEAVIAQNQAGEVVFSYSDVTHEHVMHL